MKKYKVFCRADKKGKKWQEYSGIYDRKEDAADCLLIAVNHKTMNENGRKRLQKSGMCLLYTNPGGSVLDLAHGGNFDA